MAAPASRHRAPAAAAAASTAGAAGASGEGADWRPSPPVKLAHGGYALELNPDGRNSVR